jgi:hypothetical protein
MKKEIKILYTKKTHKLKKQLHYMYIELANIWGYVWQHIKNYIGYTKNILIHTCQLLIHWSSFILTLNAT